MASQYLGKTKQNGRQMWPSGQVQISAGSPVAGWPGRYRMYVVLVAAYGASATERLLGTVREEKIISPSSGGSSLHDINHKSCSI